MGYFYCFRVKNSNHLHTELSLGYFKDTYFYCFRVKNSNHLHTELSLGYFKDTKFYFENKASFIYVSNIASFTPSLIPLLWE